MPAKASIVVNRPRAEVWSLLERDRIQEWNPLIETITDQSGERGAVGSVYLIRYREGAHLKDRYSELLAVEPPAYRRMKQWQDPPLGMYTLAELRLTERGPNETLVEQTISLEFDKPGFFSWFFKWLMNRRWPAMLQKNLVVLKKVAEKRPAADEPHA